MRTYSSALKIVAGVTLTFFSWVYLPLYSAVAFAATESGGGTKGQKAENIRQERTKTTEERFQETLDRIREAGEDRAKLKAERSEMETLDAELRKQFQETEAKIKDLPDTIKQRHRDFTKKYSESMTALKTHLDDIEKAKTGDEARVAAGKVKAFLEISRPKRHKPFNPTRLPSRTRELKPVRTSWLEKAIDWLVPSAEAAENPPTASDLAETLETPQTQEIRDLAQRLGGTSVSLYEYVRNALAYEPYAGSTKGAVQTLREKTGNEWDLASTLISLCRASGIPTRYVVGTIEIPIDKAMNWLGVEDPVMAGTLLLTLGRPTGLVYSGGKVTALRTRHVWVRAHVPFLFSRGATNGPGDMWVDIDPSFKGQTITKTLTTTGIPAFDQAGYLSTFRTESPLDFYRGQLQTFLDANHPGYVPEALAWDSEITPERFGVLIGQVPYIIKSVTGTYSEVPDSYRQKFTLSITDPSTGDSLLYYTAPMPQIIGKRMTLSYIPATTADETVIANYGGLYSTPPYLVKLKPEIKIDGVSVVQGSAAGSGQEQKMEFVFDTTIDQGRVENIIIAGGYYAIGLSSRYGGTRESILERTNQLAAVAGTIDFNDPTTLDQKLGEILYLSATVYHQNLDTITKMIASFNHVVDVRDVSEMMYSLTLKIDSVFGMPRKITPAGITGDMDRNLHTVVPFDGDMSRVKPFMQLQGNVSSFLEHDVTEKIYQTQALSSVKGIQLAHDQGIPVHTINSQNVGTELPMLQLSAELKADIANAVNAGQEVIVPERNLTLGDWSGIGFIIQDLNGKGAYLISGGYGGVALVYIAYIYDLAKAAMSDFASTLSNAGIKRRICYPSEDNILFFGKDTCYTEVQIGEVQETCGPDDIKCQKRYRFNYHDFVQPLIDINENGASTYLTKHIQAGAWRSHDRPIPARYMRAGLAVLTAIEVILGYFNVQNPQLSAGYRSFTHNATIDGSSPTSHHCDGVAADITPTDPITPLKCKILEEAYYLIGDKGEVLAEGKKIDGNYKTSVHIAIPGKTNEDHASQAVQWRCQ